MSELLENFSLEDLIIPTVEQDSMAPAVEQDSLTVSLLDHELDMDLDFDISDLSADISSDIPTDGTDFSTPSVDLSLPSDSDFDFNFNFNSDTGLFTSGLDFNSFGSTNTDQFAAPPMMMPMPTYAPQFPSFGYQAPPGYMLVPAPVFYGQQPMMPMMQPPIPMPMDSSFSFTPALDAPAFPGFDDLSTFDGFSSFDNLPSFDEPEPMSAVSSLTPTPSRTSRRNAGKKTTYKDPPTPTVPTKRQKTIRPKPEKPALEAPISVLTEGSNIPIKDMLAVATRSADVRRAEAAKAGKVSRSLNSFVCYRAAYADRIKQWTSKDSHQDVSVIAGASWKIESQIVRKFYINCAEVDRNNHVATFPDYKYAPTKKPAPETDDDDEPTPRPNKRRHLTPLFSDDEDNHIFVTSAAPTPKYNLRRRR